MNAGRSSAGCKPRPSFPPGREAGRAESRRSPLPWEAWGLFPEASVVGSQSSLRARPAVRCLTTDVAAGRNSRQRRGPRPARRVCWCAFVLLWFGRKPASGILSSEQIRKADSAPSLCHSWTTRARPHPSLPSQFQGFQRNAHREVPAPSPSSVTREKVQV